MPFRASDGFFAVVALPAFCRGLPFLQLAIRRPPPARQHQHACPARPVPEQPVRVPGPAPYATFVHAFRPRGECHRDRLGMR